jgi:Peptidase inhibitor family I36
MQFARKLLTAVSAGGAMLAAAGLFGATPASAAASHAATGSVRALQSAPGFTGTSAAVGVMRTVEVPHASYSDCPAGDVCFYTGQNGTGSMCKWSVADPDWTSGSIVCSWATTHNVKSVYNHGTSSSFSGVRYYTQTNYNGSIGCTRQGGQGNLAGTYQLRSHQWVTGHCG